MRGCKTICAVAVQPHVLLLCCNESIWRCVQLLPLWLHNQNQITARCVALRPQVLWLYNRNLCCYLESEHCYVFQQSQFMRLCIQSHECKSRARTAMSVALKPHVVVVHAEPLLRTGGKTSQCVRFSHKKLAGCTTSLSCDVGQRTGFCVVLQQQLCVVEHRRLGATLTCLNVLQIC